VDADDRGADDIAYLGRHGIAVLPVSEIENIILLPNLSYAIAEHEGYEGADLDSRLNDLKMAIFATLDSVEVVDAVVTRHCKRRIDQILKKIDLSAAATVAEITAEYGRQTATLNIAAISEIATARIHEAFRDANLPLLLANYDNNTNPPKH
jgi:uncharacterized protein with PIN domain